MFQGPAELRAVRITNLTFLAFYLNSALDTGKYANVTYREVANHIEAGDIFDFLASRLAGDIDLSNLDAAKREELTAEWRDMLHAMSARRKFGVEKNGICLVMAYVLEGIQRRQDRNPPLRGPDRQVGQSLH